MISVLEVLILILVNFAKELTVSNIDSISSFDFASHSVSSMYAMAGIDKKNVDSGDGFRKKSLMKFCCMLKSWNVVNNLLKVHHNRRTII